MTKTGMYVCVSGGEGSGKTTALQRLRGDLPEAVFVHEPGGTAFGTTMREALLARQYYPNAWTELFLLMADRMELYGRMVRPALAEGKLVISDRGWIETLVYQVLTKLGHEAVPQFLDLIRASGCPNPNLWIWLDLDPAIGLARRQASGKVNSFDADALDVHQRYRQHFGDVASILPTMPIAKIDAAQTPDQVYDAVRSAIMKIKP